MTESIPKRPADQYAHVDRQQDRDPSDAENHYTISVYAEGDQFVATQEGASLEARGFSPAEAIANYANAVAATDGEQVIR